MAPNAEVDIREPFYMLQGLEGASSSLQHQLEAERPKMPPPDDGNEFLPFVDLIKLHKIDSVTFKSIALPFSPGGQLRTAVPRAYGGHPYMQAAWAACQTVEKGFFLYNCVGHFHLPASRTVPFVYTVSKIRDGRSYSTRFVSVTQEGGNDVVVTCICSFKKEERNLLDIQDKVDLWQKYKVVLENKRPDDFEETPGMDVPWYLKLREETGHNDEFPGLETTKVDMAPYNHERNPLDRRDLMFYRAIGDLPPDPNMHLCAHLYASDRNSLYIVTQQMNVGDLYTGMGSLVHTTVFHGATEDMLFQPSKHVNSPMDDTSGNGRWFCKEDSTTRSNSGRAMFHSRVWSSNGTHIATLMQDGMIRYSKKPEATAEELAALKERTDNWKPRQKL